MAVVVKFEFADEMRESYDRVWREHADTVAAAPGRLSHLCYLTEHGFTVVDVWESRDAFEAFGPTVAPILDAIGIRGEAQFFTVHNHVPAVDPGA